MIFKMHIKKINYVATLSTLIFIKKAKHLKNIKVYFQKPCEKPARNWFRWILGSARKIMLH